LTGRLLYVILNEEVIVMLMYVKQGERFEEKNISLMDIRRICAEIIHQDPSTRGVFNRDKLKSKYIRLLKTMTEEIEPLINCRNPEELEKSLTKITKLLDKVKDLHPYMEVKVHQMGDDLAYLFKESEISQKVGSCLPVLFRWAKESARATVRNNIASDKRDKEFEAYEKRAETTEQKRHEEMQAENEAKQANMERRIMADATEKANRPPVVMKADEKTIERLNKPEKEEPDDETR